MIRFDLLLTSYLEASRGRIEGYSRAQHTWVVASDLLDSFFDRAETLEYSVRPTIADSLQELSDPLWQVPPYPRRTLLAFESATFLRSREAQVAVDVMAIQNKNMRGNRFRTRRSAATLLSSVERALER